MISKLVLNNFKSFPDSYGKNNTLILSQFSVLLGTNASGKSNICDALRFLHGIAKGYTLLEIINEKRGISGEIIWKGIRGGAREIYCKQWGGFFSLEVDIQVARKKLSYEIFVEVSEDGIPTLFQEILNEGDDRIYQFSLNTSDKYEFNRSIKLDEANTVNVKINELNLIEIKVSRNKPILANMIQSLDEQLLKYAFSLTTQSKMKNDRGGTILATGLLVNTVDEEEQLWLENSRHIKQTLSVLQSMRFFDLNPEAMRAPSLTGQTILGEQGENLSSVLHAIHEQKDDTEANMLEWLGALTPMDATDFKFYTDPYTNKVLAILIESNGQETSLYSASDGTLRFLAILAALFSPTPASLYFFEEIENGIHPSRLYLLVELLEERAKSDQ